VSSIIAMSLHGSATNVSILSDKVRCQGEMTCAGRQKTDCSVTSCFVNSTSLSNSGKHSISMPTY